MGGREGVGRIGSMWNRVEAARSLGDIPPVVRLATLEQWLDRGVIEYVDAPATQGRIGTDVDRCPGIADPSHLDW